MAMSAENRSKCAPLHRVMVTSPYEWKILEWDDKPHANNKKKPKDWFLLEIEILIRSKKYFLCDNNYKNISR